MQIDGACVKEISGCESMIGRVMLALLSYEGNHTPCTQSLGSVGPERGIRCPTKPKLGNSSGMRVCSFAGSSQSEHSLWILALTFPFVESVVGEY